MIQIPAKRPTNSRRLVTYTRRRRTRGRLWIPGLTDHSFYQHLPSGRGMIGREGYTMGFANESVFFVGRRYQQAQ